MSLQEARRYVGISAKAFQHPADRAATAALASVPLMDKVIKQLVDLTHERRLRQLLVGNAVQISDRQLPRLWSRYVSEASVLDIGQVPELFITQTPLANALTVGATRPMVIIYSGLVADYDGAEVDAVLAHELGHVLSEHYYYQTALQLLALLLATTSLAGSTPLSGVPLRALYLVLLEWSRMAELSADRASALVVDDPLVACRMLMRTAGGAVEGMDLDAFLAQAARYADEEDVISRWSRLWAETRLDHPIAVKRARELMNWVSDGSFDRLRTGSYLRRGQEHPMTSEMQEAVAHYRKRFMAMLQTASGGVERTMRQMQDWLRRRGPEDEGGGP
jgi:Zn-dependent protease with chaperone function